MEKGDKGTEYPKARCDDSVVDNYHGQLISDPFRWLEEESAETKVFVAEQNSLAIPYLQSCSYRADLERRLRELHSYPQYSSPYREGDRYLVYINSCSSKQCVLYVQDTLDSEPRMILDPNAFSEDGSVSISDESVSDDGKVLAYGRSNSGSDWTQVHFLDMDTGLDYPDVLDNVKFSGLSWTVDNAGIFYSAYLDRVAAGSKTENQRVYYHLVGTEQAEDVLVVEFPELPEARIEAVVSDCGGYLVVRVFVGVVNNLVYIGVLPEDGHVTEMLALTQIVHEFNAEYEYVTNDGPIFVFRTNKDAPNSRIVSCDITDHAPSTDWTVLLAEHANDVMEWACPVSDDKMVVSYTRDVCCAVQLHDLATGALLHELPAGEGTVAEVTGKKRHSQFFYRFNSYLEPGVIYKCSVTESDVTCTVLRRLNHPGFDFDQYECKQVRFKSKDGTEIPMYVVHQKNIPMDGSHPCLLSGYGGFQNIVLPMFNISVLMFVQHLQGVFAVPNIRGGGEFGQAWHHAGRLHNKQNGFDDFHAAAEYLIDAGYTSRHLLAAKGASNGGLLVAACCNQRPDLYAAAIIQNGVLDMLRFPLFSVGSAWVSEYGDPGDPAACATLLAYSPLHNCCAATAAATTATLLLAGEHDDRVLPLHSLKYIATLQGVRQKQGGGDGPPLLARIACNAGHGGGSTDTVDILCFLVQALGLTYYG